MAVSYRSTFEHLVVIRNFLNQKHFHKIIPLEAIIVNLKKYQKFLFQLPIRIFAYGDYDRSGLIPCLNEIILLIINTSFVSSGTISKAISICLLKVSCIYSNGGSQLGWYWESNQDRSCIFFTLIDDYIRTHKSFKKNFTF